MSLRQAEARATERAHTLLQAQESINELQGLLSEAEDEAAEAARLRDALSQATDGLEAAKKVHWGAAAGPLRSEVGLGRAHQRGACQQAAAPRPNAGGVEPDETHGVAGGAGKAAGSWPRARHPTTPASYCTSVCMLAANLNQLANPHRQDVDELSKERAALLQTCVDQAGMLQALQSACEKLRRGSQQMLAEAEDKVRAGRGGPGVL